MKLLTLEETNEFLKNKVYSLNEELKILNADITQLETTVKQNEQMYKNKIDTAYTDGAIKGGSVMLALTIVCVAGYKMLKNLYK